MPTRIEIITQIDDGRGRLRQDYDERQKSAVTMTCKEDWRDVNDPGDYAFSHFVETFEIVVMGCPFCSFEAPLPLLIKITSRNPLTIAQELFCKKCDTFFHVIEGKAYKSWARLEFDRLNRHLKST